jgi:perosamine synthetase
MDPTKVEAAITPKTKAIMPVHIFGTVCDMAALQIIADTHGLALIEDAAEAHGAEFKGRKAGALSKIAAFSFFANKNLTTGEGGMVVTDDDELAKACRYYKNMCFPLDAPRNYLHANLGYNYRMSNLHAALGLAQTERADHYRDLRRRNGALYRELLGRIPGVRLQADQLDGLSVSWMNGLCVTPEYGRTRQELIDHLKANQIDTRLFFNGMHRQPALKDYGCACGGSFPVSDSLADTGFYLPSGSGLTSQDIEHVCSTIAIFAKINAPDSVEEEFSSVSSITTSSM